MARGDAKKRLLAAAMQEFRRNGYSATSVEDLCQAAGVTKGAFFHHFASKEEVAVASAQHWSETTGALFAAADYHQLADPLDRLLAYVDFRKSLLKGELPEFTCLVGTMVQETYDTNELIRSACGASISSHAATLEPMIAEAIEARGIAPGWSPRSLALHIQAVIQGSFILAKATGGSDIAAESLHHLKLYLTLLFRDSGTGPRLHGDEPQRKERP